MFGPDPNAIYPNESIRQVVYIKNVITRPNILVGTIPITTTRTARSGSRSM